MSRPYTPETLANRWGVSATMIRNMCGAGDIEHFRLGDLRQTPSDIRERQSSPTSAIIEPTRLPANCVMAIPNFGPRLENPPEQFTPNSAIYVLVCGTLKKSG